MYGWAVMQWARARQEQNIRGEIVCLFFTSSVFCRRERHSAIWAVYSQTERGFYLQVVFNSIRRLLKSFIKFVQKGLFCFGKNWSEKHITRQKNTVVINVFIAKKLDFQTVLLF